MRDFLHDRNESASVFRLLEELFVRPMITVSGASELLGISDPGTRRVLNRLIDAGIVTVREGTWPRLYMAKRLLEEVDRPITPSGE